MPSWGNLPGLFLGGLLLVFAEVANLRVERIREVHQRPVTSTGRILHAACGREYAVRAKLSAHAFPAESAGPVDRAQRVENLIDFCGPTFGRNIDQLMTHRAESGQDC